MSVRKPTRAWRRWHRWLGLSIVIPVIVLSVTGVLLNHLDSLAFSKHPMPLWAAHMYGFSVSEELPAGKVAGRWYAHANSRLLVEDGQPVQCEPPFYGVIETAEGVLAGCGSALLLLDAEGRLQERLGAAYGVPHFNRMGVNDAGALVLASDDTFMLYDVVHLAATPYAGLWQPWRVTPLPLDVHAGLRGQAIPTSLSWERLLLDIHAGRFFGRLGVWVMDVVAVILILLSLSGMVVWSRSRR